MTLNLEQAVLYLMDILQEGIKIKQSFTDISQLLPYLTEDNIGSFYLVNDNLYVITKYNDLSINAKDLGVFPKAGPQGLQGEQGPAATITINNLGNWVINGIDTGKKSFKEGPRGTQGLLGRPGLGVDNLTELDSISYDPTITEDGPYEIYTTTADLKFYSGDEEHISPVVFTYKIRKVTNYVTQTINFISTSHSHYVSPVTGLGVDDETYNASGFMDVLSSKLTIRQYYSGNAGIAFYNEEWNFIKGYNLTGDVGDSRTFTVPSNAYYYRVSCLKDNINDIGGMTYDSTESTEFLNRRLTNTVALKTTKLYNHHINLISDNFGTYLFTATSTMSDSIDLIEGQLETVGATLVDWYDPDELNVHEARLLSSIVNYPNDYILIIQTITTSDGTTNNDYIDYNLIGQLADTVVPL